MNHWVLSTAALALLLPAGEPGGDLKEVQGTWRVVILMDSGETIAVAKASRVTIAQDKLTLKDKAYPLEVKFTLDPSKNPRRIDLGTEPTQYPGIYELKGDTLKICYNERPRGERPTVFGSMANSPSDVLLVLEREKK
jgi:uncharacterized protein (TIGR03067 family)